LAVHVSERRRQNRAARAQFQPLKITIVNPAGQATEAPARLMDVTEEGIGVEIGIPLAVGGEVRVFAPDGINGRIGAHKARVRWCKPGRAGAFNCGLMFDDGVEPRTDRERQERPPTPEPDGTLPDLYEILQLGPNADLDTIHRVFRILAQRYHPDNNETGNEERFKLLLAAYQALSDPERRAAYDARRTIQNKVRWRIFDQPGAAVGVEAEKRKRQGVLSLLYMKRLSGGLQPLMSMHEFEELLGCPREHLDFTLWYLKDAGFVSRTDNGRYGITVKGVDHAEEEGLWCPSTGRMLPAPGQP
jgi:hypothetical protein